MENSEREKINRHLAGFMGLCVHSNVRWVDEDLGPGLGMSHYPLCINCKEITDGNDLPDFCSSDSPRHLLDAVRDKVIETVGVNKLWNVLQLVLNGEDGKQENGDVLLADAPDLALAAARATGFELADGDEKEK